MVARSTISVEGVNTVGKIGGGQDYGKGLTLLVTCVTTFRYTRCKATDEIAVLTNTLKVCGWALSFSYGSQRACDLLPTISYSRLKRRTEEEQHTAHDGTCEMSSWAETAAMATAKTIVKMVDFMAAVCGEGELVGLFILRGIEGVV